MMSEKELLEKREQMIERLGVYIEKGEQLAPVASRIFATLVLTCRQGMTFEQLVDSLGASKSTIWTHLNTLEANDRIDYFTKPGDRKRYYKPASNRLLRFINEKIERCEADIEIQREIIAYKQQANEVWKDHPDKHCDLQFNQDLQIFLNETITSFKRLKENLTKNQKTQ